MKVSGVRQKCLAIQESPPSRLPWERGILMEFRLVPLLYDLRPSTFNLKILLVRKAKGSTGPAIQSATFYLLPSTFYLFIRVTRSHQPFATAKPIRLLPSTLYLLPKLLILFLNTCGAPKPLKAPPVLDRPLQNAQKVVPQNMHFYIAL
mgnify:CR=1 FL=1